MMDVALTRSMIAINGTSLHVTSGGAGFPVVLVHGFPQTSYEWRHLLPPLSQHFRVIAPDLRGIGDSAPENTGQDKRTLARDIRGLLEDLRISRAVLIGHDWGGGVVQQFALDFSDAIERLICVDTPYFPGLPPLLERDWPAKQLVHSWYIFLQLNSEIPERIAEAAAEPYLRWFFEHGSGPRGCPLTAKDIDEYARWFKQPGRATAAFNLYRTWATTDVETWRAVKDRVFSFPTLWIHGMRDPFVPAPRLDVLSRTFTNLRIERFEECGHWTPEEAPERTTAVIQDFLKDLG